MVKHIILWSLKDEYSDSEKAEIKKATSKKNIFIIKSQNIRSYPPKSKERVKMKNQKVDKLSTKNKGF